MSSFGEDRLRTIVRNSECEHCVMTLSIIKYNFGIQCVSIFLLETISEFKASLVNEAKGRQSKFQDIQGCYTKKPSFKKLIYKKKKKVKERVKSRAR